MINERFHQGVGRPKSLFGFSDGRTRSTCTCYVAIQ